MRNACPDAMMYGIFINVTYISPKLMVKVQGTVDGKSCTTCDARNGFETAIKTAFRASEAVQGFFHQQ